MSAHFAPTCGCAHAHGHTTHRHDPAPRRGSIRSRLPAGYPRTYRIIEVVQTKYPHRPSQARVHLRGPREEKVVYEGRVGSARMRALFAQARKEGIPISRALSARVVHDPDPAVDPFTIAMGLGLVLVGVVMYVQSKRGRAPVLTKAQSAARVRELRARGYKVKLVRLRGQTVVLRSRHPVRAAARRPSRHDPVRGRRPDPTGLVMLPKRPRGHKPGRLSP